MVKNPLVSNAPGAKRGFAGGVLGSLGTFYHRRWLMWYFVHRQLTRRYRGSFLGFFWAFLGPLLMVALLSLVFSPVIGLRDRFIEGDPTLNFGLYMYCGLLPFLAYSDALSKGVNSIRNNSQLVEKVVFPMEFLPFSVSIISMIDKIFGLGALVFVLVLLEGRLEWTILLLPALLVLQLLFVLGLCYFIAVAGTFLPDVGEALRSIVRATFFVTPIIWPVDRLPERLHFLVDYNPLAYLVDAYRDLILRGELPGGMATLYFALFAGALFVCGFALFVRVKSRFAEVL